nr:chromate transporter [bacterium]
MRDFLELFMIFFRVGICTFGGGYAMLPILQQELVDKRHRISMEEVMDYYAVAQCMPGIIAVNTSSLIGHKLKGTWGAVAAALGIVFPSLLIIMAISAFLQQFSHIVWVGHAFAGIRVAV